MWRCWKSWWSQVRATPLALCLPTYLPTHLPACLPAPEEAPGLCWGPAPLPCAAAGQCTAPASAAKFLGNLALLLAKLIYVKCKKWQACVAAEQQP